MKENLVLKSVRLSPETLDAIDRFADKHAYWTRNAVINSILTTVMESFTEREIYDMVRRNPFKNEHITAVFKINSLMDKKQ